MKRGTVWPLLVLIAGCAPNSLVLDALDGCAQADCCVDGTKNGREVDIDCGYKCKQKCRRDRHCVLDEDCHRGHRCTTEEDISLRTCQPVAANYQ